MWIEDYWTGSITYTLLTYTVWLNVCDESTYNGKIPLQPYWKKSLIQILLTSCYRLFFVWKKCYICHLCSHLISLSLSLSLCVWDLSFMVSFMVGEMMGVGGMGPLAFTCFILSFIPKHPTTHKKSGSNRGKILYYKQIHKDKKDSTQKDRCIF